MGIEYWRTIAYDRSMETNDFLTIAQVAAQLGLSEGAVRRLISDNKLTSFSLPGMQRPRLVSRAEVARYQRERQPRGRPPTSRPTSPEE